MLLQTPILSLANEQQQEVLSLEHNQNVGDALKVRQAAIGGYWSADLALTEADSLPMQVVSRVHATASCTRFCSEPHIRCRHADYPAAVCLPCAVSTSAAGKAQHTVCPSSRVPWARRHRKPRANRHFGIFGRVPVVSSCPARA